MIGQTLGHYRITAKLGEGGMGVVWRGHDTRLERDVALKVLPASLANDHDRLQRFEREARTLAALNHPNIAAIHGMEHGALVMELVEGPSLADRVRQGALPADEVIAIARQIIDGLEAAHEKGIIHRDLKPANIKLTPEGQVKLLDFGLAKALDPAAPAHGKAEDSPTLTVAASMPGMILGTAAYMSPEQARGARLDHRTDIWAFGVVLFELATGRRLFTGETVSDVLAAVLRADPAIERASAPLRPLLSRCLERDQRQRLGWIGEARRLLHQPLVPPEPVTTRRGLLITTAAAAGGVTVGAGATAWLTRRDPAPANTISTRLTRITTDGASIMPVLSPDAKLVAYLYLTRGQAGNELRVKPVTGGSGARLASGAAGVRPAFSADGSRVYYSSAGDRVTGEGRGIQEVQTIGGESRMVVPGVVGRTLATSPDGRWLAYFDGGRLVARDLARGESRDLGPGERDFSVILWSSDSSRLMVANGLQAWSKSIRIIGVDGAGERLLDTGSIAKGLGLRGLGGDLIVASFAAWLPGDDVVMSLRQGDAANWWRVSLDNPAAAPTPLTAGFSHLFTTADLRGNRLAFTDLQVKDALWLLPADVNAGRVTGEPRRLTPEGGNGQFPNLHPDGRQLLYAAERSGAFALVVHDLATGRERILYQTPDPPAHCVWSPDGQQVAFFLRQSGWPAFVMPAAGGTPRKIGDSGGRIRGWTRDGRFLTVWRVTAPANTAGVLEIATGKYTPTMAAPGEGGIAVVRLSPDNRFLVFAAGLPGQAKLYVAPFRGDQPVAESEWIALAGQGNPFWAPDSRAVYTVRSSALHRQALDGNGKPVGSETQVYSAETSPLRLSSADGVIATVAAAKDGIVLVSHDGRSDVWLAELPDAALAAR